MTVIPAGDGQGPFGGRAGAAVGLAEKPLGIWPHTFPLSGRPVETVLANYDSNGQVIPNTGALGEAKDYVDTAKLAIGLSLIHI